MIPELDIISLSTPLADLLEEQYDLSAAHLIYIYDEIRDTRGKHLLVKDLIDQIDRLNKPRLIINKLMNLGVLSQDVIEAVRRQ